MRNLIIIALLAATSITPAMAQRGDRGEGREDRGRVEGQSRGDYVRERFGQRPDRGSRNDGGRPERQIERQREAPQSAAPVRAQAAAPVQTGDRGAGQWQGRRGWDGDGARVRGEDGRRDGEGWRGRDRGERRGENRGDEGRVRGTPVTPGQSVFDRNGNGRVDPRYDRNRDGRADRHWDRNRDGTIDRRWDRNRDGQFDRRYDRNGDGRADRRWDRNRGHQHSWNRGWRDNHRYDWHGYRNRYGSLYRAPRYYHPYGSGYGYRSFGIGIYLDSLFYGSRYWVNDPYNYRLPDAPYGYRWVRYYDDVLLVDMRSGYVVDVIRNFFW